MAIDNERIANRAGYGMLAGVIIASIALGLVIWRVGNYSPLSVLYTMLVAIGVYLVAVSFGKGSELSFIPSESSYYLVTGCLVATVGALGFVALFTNINIWILVAVFVLVVALLIVYRSISKKG